MKRAPGLVVGRGEGVSTVTGFRRCGTRGHGDDRERRPLKVVSEILGHFSVSITGDIYGHVSPDVSAQAMDAHAAALDG